MRIRAAAAAPLVLLVACAGQPLSGEVPPGCNQTRVFAFNGWSSFAALGISTGSDTDEQTGYVWVTAGKVPFWGSIRVGASTPPPARAACLLHPGGSATIVSIPDDWTPRR
ncbi:MAG: hypothetical protein ABJC24_08765 [Chloroflexota bacterium]